MSLHILEMRAGADQASQSVWKGRVRRVRWVNALAWTGMGTGMGRGVVRKQPCAHAQRGSYW